MLLLPVSSPLTSGDTAMFYILMVAVILSNRAEYVVLQLLVSCLNQWKSSDVISCCWSGLMRH